MEKTVKLTNDTGLHARPAGVFVKAASQFSSQIKIRANDQTINAKSIMNLLSLGLETGSELTIIADGPDAEAALNSLVHLVENKFEAHA
jgi:phosphocarrier protein HPr